MALWSGLAELGAIGAAFDEAHGGYAGDARTLAVAMAELGRSLVVEPFLACAVVAGHVLSQPARTRRVANPRSKKSLPGALSRSWRTTPAPIRLRPADLRRTRRTGSC